MATLFMLSGPKGAGKTWVIRGPRVPLSKFDPSIDCLMSRYGWSEGEKIPKLAAPGDRTGSPSDQRLILINDSLAFPLTLDGHGGTNDGHAHILLRCLEQHHTITDSWQSLEVSIFGQIVAAGHRIVVIRCEVPMEQAAINVAHRRARSQQDKQTSTPTQWAKRDTSVRMLQKIQDRFPNVHVQSVTGSPFVAIDDVQDVLRAYLNEQGAM